jgi:hypothetical protein
MYAVMACGGTGVLCDKMSCGTGDGKRLRFSAV